MTLQERKQELIDEINKKTSEVIELQGALKEVDRMIKDTPPLPPK